MEAEELVDVYSVKTPTEAEIIRVALENEGIPCRLDGESQAGLTGIFDIRVLVRAMDEDAARQLLASYEIAKQDDDEEEA